jgi:bacterioferritin-associated ferredoxin
MFVCHCRAVTDREIREAIAAGASDLDEVGSRCGAGITCGGCCPLIQELLAEWRTEPALVGPAQALLGGRGGSELPPHG